MAHVKITVEWIDGVVREYEGDLPSLDRGEVLELAIYREGTMDSAHKIPLYHVREVRIEFITNRLMRMEAAARPAVPRRGKAR